MGLTKNDIGGSASVCVPAGRLHLNAEEQEFLSNILERRHQELLNEIVHTEHRDFKQALLKDEKLLDSLVCRLQGTAVQELRG